MSKNSVGAPGGDSGPIATDSIDSVEFQRFKLTLGAVGVDDNDVSSTNPIPVMPTLVEKVPTWATVVIGTPGTPTALAVDGTFATSIRLEAKKAGGVNTGIVYVGNLAVDKDSAHGHSLSPGDTWEYLPRFGAKFDLNDLYIDGAQTDDAVVFVYEPA